MSITCRVTIRFMVKVARNISKCGYFITQVLGLWFSFH